MKFLEEERHIRKQAELDRDKFQREMQSIEEKSSELKAQMGRCEGDVKSI